MFQQLKISTLATLVLIAPSLSSAQVPPPPASGTTSSPAPFTVQMPPSQGGLPTGVLPPTQTFTPGQIPTSSGTGGGYVPMALPPSSGGFNPNQNNAPMNMYNVPTQSGSSNQSTTPTRSEVVFYNPKHEIKSVLVVKTSEGEFKITLKPDIAPINVENFLDLALGQKEFVDVRTSKKVKRPFYTGLNCHRVIRSVLIQCGCPFGNGRGGPGFTVTDERSSAMKFDRPGVVAMALARSTDQNAQAKDGIGYAPNTAGSQFFISLGPLPEYTGHFTVIGQITSGMDTIRKIASTPTGPTDRPIKRVIIFSVDPDLPPITPVAPIADPVVDPMTMPMGGAPVVSPTVTAPAVTSPLSVPTSPSAPTLPSGAIDPFAMPPPASP